MRLVTDWSMVKNKAFVVVRLCRKMQLEILCLDYMTAFRRG